MPFPLSQMQSTYEILYYNIIWRIQPRGRTLAIMPKEFLSKKEAGCDPVDQSAITNVVLKSLPDHTFLADVHLYLLGGNPITPSVLLGFCIGYKA